MTAHRFSGFLIASAIALGAVLAAPASADDAERLIVIKDHMFSPASVEIPADTRVKLTIDNQDATPEEFESRDLHREKIVPPNSKIIVWVGPLEAGTYEFVGEFHEDTAKGSIVVK